MRNRTTVKGAVKHCRSLNRFGRVQLANAASDSKAGVGKRT
nr:hypothetical protein [uncultured Acetobacteroides sp.]